jgi:hypothetical protein
MILWNHVKTKTRLVYLFVVSVIVQKENPVLKLLFKLFFYLSFQDLGICMVQRKIV